MLLLFRGLTWTEHSGTASFDSILLRTASGSAVADAIVLRQSSSAWAASSVIKGTVSSAFAADAIKLKTSGDSSDIDAVLLATSVSSWPADAILKKTASHYAPADAVIKKEQYASLSADASLSATIVAQATVDAMLTKLISGSFLARSVLLAEIAGSWKIDSAISTTITGSFVTYGIMRQISESSFGLRARIYKPYAPRFALYINGVNVIDNVVLADARFNSQTNGAPGMCSFRVKDLRNGSYSMSSFPTGAEMILTIDNDRLWGGFITKVTQSYAFPVVDTTVVNETERFWNIEGADYNILFSRRFVYNLDRPTHRLRTFPKNTTDKQVLTHVMDNWVDLTGDGLHTNGIKHVGTPGPFSKFKPASPGDSLGTVFSRVAQNNGAIFYIDPNKVLRYVDDETVTAEYGLSDVPLKQPLQLEVGYRDLTITESATEMANDVMVWGAGMGRPKMVFSRKKSETSIAKHGRFQFGVLRNDNWKTESVARYANTYLNGSPMNRRGHKNNHDFIRCTVYEPSFRAGQVVSFSSVAHDYYDNVPIRNMTITFPTRESVKFELELSHEIDPGHTTADPYPYDDPSGDPRVGDDYVDDPQWSYKDEIKEVIDLGEAESLVASAWWQYTFDTALHQPVVQYRLLPLVTSYIYQNTPWPDAGCVNAYGLPIGSGRWGPNYKKQSLWYRVIGAEPQENDERDLFVEIPDIAATGYIEGYTVGISNHSTIGPGRLDPLRPPTTLEMLDYTVISDVEIPADLQMPDGISTTRTIPGTIVRIPREYRSSEGNWIVITPRWTPDYTSFCDVEYADPNDPYRTQGPRVTGQGKSGWMVWLYNLNCKLALVPQMSDAAIWPTDGNETNPDFDDADGSQWVTKTPYKPGTLDITIDGVHLREGVDFWEIDPAYGTFRIAVSGDLKITSRIVIRYNTEEYFYTNTPPGSYNPDRTGQGGGSGLTPLRQPSHYSGNRVYRPRFVSQLGWGYWDDGINCVLAASAVAVDRHSLGTVRAKSPHEMRIWLQDFSGGITLNQVHYMLEHLYGFDVYSPGEIKFELFEMLINEGRGAVCHGDSRALPLFYQARSEYTGERWAGPHALYVNEQRSDGYFYVYDPAFRPNSKYHVSPGWYPREAIKAYLSYPSDVAYGYAAAVYTRKTGKK